MEITKEKIVNLGFKFTDFDDQTDRDYTFEKEIKDIPKTYFYLVWQPISNEVTISQYDKKYRGTNFTIKRIYQGFPRSIKELEETLNTLQNGTL